MIVRAALETNKYIENMAAASRIDIVAMPYNIRVADYGMVTQDFCSVNILLLKLNCYDVVYDKSHFDFASATLD